MPELPEVHRAERACHELLVGKKIIDVETKEDLLVFCGMPHEKFAEHLLNKTVTETGRRGKYFYFLFDEGPHPVFHFGMTGDIKFKGHQSFHYRRRRPSSSILSHPPLSDLGFDPLQDIPSLAAFSAQVSSRKCPIKALLLDQSFSAGVGNWVADEVLYQARVHPNQRANTLNKEQIRMIREKMVWVCEKAVEVNANPDEFPKDWLFHVRWSKSKKNKVKMSDGNEVIFLNVGGRTTAVVPAIQKIKGDVGSFVKEIKDDTDNNSKVEDDDIVVVEETKQNKRAVKRKTTKGDEFGRGKVSLAIWKVGVLSGLFLSINNAQYLNSPCKRARARS
ncbi:3870_t:CDS:2 [Paraglomus occultum]|uniref:3870_t:CDS:1 n=1 Tax=Paraglomus occultum TaxID=144539 RepID=A0A9N8YYF2_9GLOM|nr:3870_t:CDS:2 [Paraglomus occultum]